mmetsp:Transcript_2948/g.7811  ORF Transcript_2948/g.7811 Transcript_2948/m.7811 type:complete len:373 (+) Transcript_2948:64-1182(+)
MGCSCSMPALGTSLGSVPTRAEQSKGGAHAAENTHYRGASAMASLLQETNQGALDAFHRADHNNSGNVSREELRTLFPTIDLELLDAFFSLADVDKDGMVSQSEFLMSIALLTKGCSAPVQQVDACFTMFDKDGSGSLSHDEFRRMIRVSVSLNLNYVLKTEAGRKRMEEQLAKEYSEENIEFWKAVQEFQHAPDGERAAAAADLAKRYVRSGAERQVNLPDNVARAALKAVDAADKSGQPPSADVFDRAQSEIFRLMERDTFSRFKSDPTMVDKLADDFFSKVDVDASGRVSYVEYRKWALNEPTVIVFFSGLMEASKAIIEPVHAARVSSKASTGEGGGEAGGEAKGGGEGGGRASAFVIEGAPGEPQKV